MRDELYEANCYFYQTAPVFVGVVPPSLFANGSASPARPKQRVINRVSVSVRFLFAETATEGRATDASITHSSSSSSSMTGIAPMPSQFVQHPSLTDPVPWQIGQQT